MLQVNHSALLDLTRNGLEFDNLSESKHQESVVDSDATRIQAKIRASREGIGGFGLLKVINVGLYQVTFCLTVGYFWSTKYTNSFVANALKTILIGRPCLILIYSVAFVLLDWQRHLRVKKERAKRQ